VNLGEGQSPKAARQVIPTEIAKADGVDIDWDAVSKTLQDNSGLPRLVGVRQGANSWHRLDTVF
jgi:L,D-transpeptidase ErfK/SrfK